MRTTRGTSWRGRLLLCGCAAWSLVAVATVRAQSLDMDVAPSTLAAATHQSGELDMDVSPSASIVTPAGGKSPIQTLSSGANVQDGIVQVNLTVAPEPTPPPVQTTTTTPVQTTTLTQPPDPAQPGPTTDTPPPAEPISLDHPTVVDTARLKAGDTTVTLFGIDGMQGEAAENLQGFLASGDNHVTCQAQPSADFVCLMSDGTDVAQAALINGAARVKDDAPEAYRDQQAAAQAARRGIWASLPPPPATITHPTVQDTATLVADNQTYVLDGLQGLGAPYAGQMQGYIAANGDSLSCSPQATPGHYICVLADGTDVAQVALVNGGAVVASDAPDSYRLQQREALNNHRGIWVNPPPNLLVAYQTVQSQDCCVFVAGDEGGDGITYVGGVPEAVIDGASVFLTYGGDAGWGYYDHDHHWRDAPGRYREHMEHFHPGGHGLRGYHDEAVARRDGGHPEGVHPEGGAHPGEVHTASLAGHPGVVPGAHPGAASGVHPGVASGVHPGVAQGVHPGMAPAGHSLVAPGAHPSMAGGGFVHPGASAAGFHPGGMPSHAAAPAAHASSGGGGGGKKK
jgi:endonuclease YncB( thermonuclease family)